MRGRRRRRTRPRRDEIGTGTPSDDLAKKIFSTETIAGPASLREQRRFAEVHETEPDKRWLVATMSGPVGTW